MRSGSKAASKNFMKKYKIAGVVRKNSIRPIEIIEKSNPQGA